MLHREGMTFLGDVMVGRKVASATSPAHLVHALRNVADSRRLCVNLECCITDQTRPSAHAHSAFSGSYELVGSLGAAGVCAASLANNHALDFGPQGLQDTIDALEAHGVACLGVRHPGEEIRPYETRLGDRDVVVFACCAMTLPGQFWKAGIIEARADDLTAAIQARVRREKYVVVYVHWGQEMITVPPPETLQVAQHFARLGVNLVVGHGPHVVHGRQRLDDCDVFYSIGDAVFDRPDIPGRDWGVAVHVDSQGTGLDRSRSLFQIDHKAFVPVRVDSSALEAKWEERSTVLQDQQAYRSRFAQEASRGFLRKQLLDTVRLVRRSGARGLYTKLRGLRRRHFKSLGYSFEAMIRRAGRLNARTHSNPHASTGSMRILYIHQYFCTRQGSTGTRSYEFAKYLVRRGHRVTMLTSTSDVTDVELPSGKKTHRYQVDGIDVLAIRVAYSQSMGTLRRVSSFLKFMLISTWIACRQRGHDVVFATSTPLTAGLPGVCAGLVLRVPFVFEVRDLWPEAPIQMGVIRNPLWIMLLLAFEKLLYARASRIVALSPGMQKGILARGVHSSKVVVIPNCCDLDLFQPGSPDPGFAELFDLHGQFVLLHAGSMGAANDLDVLVSAAASLRNRGHDDFRFLVLGQGSTEEHLRTRLRALNLDNVTLVPSVPRADVAQFVRASHACLVLFRNLPVLATNSPNKLFDALAGGRPVIVNSDGWTRDLVERHGVGRFAEPGSPDSLADEILWLRNHPDEREAMGARARQLSEREFDRLALASEVENVFQSVVGIPSAEKPLGTVSNAEREPRESGHLSDEHAHTHPTQPSMNVVSHEVTPAGSSS